MSDVAGVILLQMKRILIVDDDIPTLDSLRVRLHRMQDKWSVTFVDSGGAALTELQRQPFDLIVSDIRMAGMPGTRLLRTVAERWPHVVRIALSGIVDEQQSLALAPIAHQFVSKPSEPPLLEDAIARCLALQDLLLTPALRAVVGRVRRLAPLRGTCARLQAVMADGTADARKVAVVVASDTVVAAKVLQMANSAFFRRGARVTSIERAVTHLGLSTLRNLVICAEIFAQWPERVSSPAPDLERLQQHSSAVLTAAHALTAGTAIEGDTILAALLHDIGYWILAHEHARELDAARVKAGADRLPMHEAERETIGVSHAEVGAYLLGIWGLPHAVVEAVAYHHAPQRIRQTGFDVLAALAVAHSLAGTSDADAFGGAVPDDVHVTAGYLEALQAPFSWDEASRRAVSSLQALASGSA